MKFLVDHIHLNCLLSMSFMHIFFYNVTVTGFCFQFELVCDRANLFVLYQLFVSFGSVCGALVGGVISERWDVCYTEHQYSKNYHISMEKSCTIRQVCHRDMVVLSIRALIICSYIISYWISTRQ